MYQEICVLVCLTNIMSQTSSAVILAVAQTLTGDVIVLFIFVSIWKYLQKQIKDKSICHSNNDFKTKHQNLK